MGLFSERLRTIQPFKVTIFATEVPGIPIIFNVIDKMATSWPCHKSKILLRAYSRSRYHRTNQSILF